MREKVLLYFLGIVWVFVMCFSENKMAKIIIRRVRLSVKNRTGALVKQVLCGLGNSWGCGECKTTNPAYTYILYILKMSLMMKTSDTDESFVRLQIIFKV